MLQRVLDASSSAHDVEKGQVPLQAACTAQVTGSQRAQLSGKVCIVGFSFIEVYYAMRKDSSNDLSFLLA